MDENIIELADLTKKYGGHTVVDKLNLTITKGEVFGLLGPNGAGKSTTILMMMGLTDPDSGSVRVCDIDSTTHPIDVKKWVGYLPEDVGFYDDYSGLENLVYTARLNGYSRKEALQKAEQLLKKVGLTEHAEKKAGKYSRGMRQRLGLADVLIKNPRVIILDEPTLGIDPTGIKEFLELIVELSKEEGITVLFSSHLLHQVQQVCHRVGLFISGKLLAVGDINSLSKKLFDNSAYTVEVGISGSSAAKSNETNRYKKLLQGIEGVTSVKTNNSIFHVECSRDITASIAKAVVESGANLSYLNKKEFGLDDIYQHYFEGGLNHE